MTSNNNYFRSLQSNISTTSSNMARRANAADQLNRTLLFGESERPDDLTADWCYVSAKNAHKRVEHATRLAREREGEREREGFGQGGRKGGG